MGQSERATDLNELLIFARVVRASSFIGAARELQMPKSTVSRKVSELERRLGARLLQRTTRKLSLTDAGRAYHEHAVRVVAEVEAAERAVSRMQDVPRGLLRVTTPLNFGFLGPIVASFLQRFPDVQVEMVCADRVIDLVDEGFDLAIRAGKLVDSTSIARELGAALESYVVASPGFLKKHGTPKLPQDLANFDCVVFAGGAHRASWELHRDGEVLTVNVRPRILVNDFRFIEEATAADLGLALVPVFRCIDALREKRLVRVLPGWCTTDIPLHAVYPSTRHLTPKVKAFVEHVRDHMSPPPWERGPAV
jgi:DNA-binding transcriptional LysR family regulator